MKDIKGPERKLPEFRKLEPKASPQKTFRSLSILAVLACGVFLVIYLGLGWIAREDLSVAELYTRSLDGRRDSKRMSALEWARRLHLYESRGQERELRLLSPDSSQSRRLSEVIKRELSPKDSNGEAADSTYLGGLVTVIGFSRLPPPAALDLEKLLLLVPAREWPDVQIHLLLALSRLQVDLSPALRDRLLVALSEDDVSVRKTAAFTVGALAKTPETRDFFRARLLELSHDSLSDVRWNAGFALGRWQDTAAESVLAELIGLAERVRRDATMTDGEPDEVMTESLFNSFDQAFRLIAERPEGELRQKLSVISRQSPHLKLRQSAISALRDKK